MPDALRTLGELVERHADHFQKGVADVVWLPFAASRRWMILTKDPHIAFNPLERRAVRENKACVFALRSGQMTGEEMAEAFALARHRMKQFAKKHQGPFIAKVGRDGNVEPWKFESDL